MGCGDSDVGEDADVSGVLGLCGGGEDGLGGGEARWLVVTGSPWFVESSVKTSQTVSHSFSISVAMCFWSP